MRIISKYKDYYDYLAGIYGIDDKLVLDRSKSGLSKLCNSYNENYNLFRFRICGYIIEGLYYNGNMYYFDQIESLPDIVDGSKSKNFFDKDNEFYYYNDNGKRFRSKVLKSMVKDPDNLNGKCNCPILIAWKETPTYGDSFYPILSEYQFHKAIPAEQMWLMLSEWLSKNNEPVINDNRTNVEKIVCNGFDTKTSFRSIK